VQKSQKKYQFLQKTHQKSAKNLKKHGLFTIFPAQIKGEFSKKRNPKYQLLTTSD